MQLLAKARGTPGGAAPVEMTANAAKAKRRRS
jgi:hypothetical protein